MKILLELTVKEWTEIFNKGDVEILVKADGSDPSKKISPQREKKTQQSQPVAKTESKESNSTTKPKKAPVTRPKTSQRKAKTKTTQRQVKTKPEKTVTPDPLSEGKTAAQASLSDIRQIKKLRKSGKTWRECEQIVGFKDRMGRNAMDALTIANNKKKKAQANNNKATKEKKQADTSS